MKAKRETVTTETHRLTHGQLVEAIALYVTNRSDLDRPDAEVKISRDNSWANEGKEVYGAKVILTVDS